MMTGAQHIPLPEPPEKSERETKPFYQHPYGGIARDIFVTREGFARFFGFSVEYIDRMPTNIKLFDDIFPGGESYGYKLRSLSEHFKRMLVEYRITIIDHSTRSKIAFHRQTFGAIQASLGDGSCNDCGDTHYLYMMVYGNCGCDCHSTDVCPPHGIERPSDYEISRLQVN